MTFGSVKIHKCVFSTDIMARIFSTVSYFLSHFYWSVNYMSQVSKFHNFFLTCSKTEARCTFERFQYCLLWKVQFQLSSNFFSFFFIWSVNCSSHFLVPFCWSVNFMSWDFDFRDVQKLKHDFIFESFQYCYLSKVNFVLFVPIQTFLWSGNCTILVCKLCFLFQTIFDL